MKNLKHTILTVCMTIIYSIASATVDNKADDKLSMLYSVKAYIDGVSSGKLDDLGDVIDDNATFSILRGEKIITYNKTAELKALKKMAGVQQNCETSYTLIENKNAQAIIKVTMTYSQFVRTNYVTMTNTGNGWKITHVSSVFA